MLRVHKNMKIRVKMKSTCIIISDAMTDIAIFAGELIGSGKVEFGMGFIGQVLFNNGGFLVF
ncbi:hypothetical protein HanIR_Chr02g0080281 [Helianthus annuus]|nr:hypothetical protein HanIR_Chr02g0080281 [Helianthus annuus]